MRPGQLDHAFLQRRHRGVAHFNGQVATRHHDAVASAQDFFKVWNGFGALDFCNQCRLVLVRCSSHIAELARHLHVGSVLREAHGNIVSLESHRRFDVFHVLACQRRSSQATALLVDALVVGQHAALLDGGLHDLAAHSVHHQHDQAVIEQQHVARTHVARQFFVVKPDALDVAGLGARRIEHEFFADDQHHLAFGKFSDADFRALQVGHDGDLLAGALGGGAHHGGKLDVVLGLAVAEVQPHHVHAGANHFFEQYRVAGSGAERGNNLGGAI